MTIAVRRRPSAPRRRRITLEPRTEALAFRIWQVADPLGWDITPDDLAGRLDVSRRQVDWICAHKGWSNRLRATKTDLTVPHIAGLTAFGGGFGTTMLPDFDEAA